MDLDDDENYQMDFYYSIFDRLHTPKVYYKENDPMDFDENDAQNDCKINLRR